MYVQRNVYNYSSSAWPRRVVCLGLEFRIRVLQRFQPSVGETRLTLPQVAKRSGDITRPKDTYLEPAPNMYFRPIHNENAVASPRPGQGQRLSCDASTASMAHRQRQEPANATCRPAAISAGPRLCNDCPRRTGSNLRRGGNNRHANRRRRRPHDSVHCGDTGER